MAGAEFLRLHRLVLSRQSKWSRLDPVEVDPGDVDDLLHHVGPVRLERVVERPRGRMRRRPPLELAMPASGGRAVPGSVDPRRPSRKDTLMVENRKQTVKTTKDLPPAHPARMFIKADRFPRVSLEETEVDLGLATPVPHLDLP